MLGATKLFRTAFVGMAALAIIFGAAASAEAKGGHHHHGHHHHGGGGWGWAGPAFVGGLALGALATPYYGYGYGYGAPCYRERHVYYTRSGHRVVRWVRVCY